MGWPTGCSGVGFGIGFKGASSGSAGLVEVWLFAWLTSGGLARRAGFRCRICSLVRFGDFGPCVEHTLCGCGWMFFFVLLNGAVLVGVVVLDSVCVCVCVYVWGGVAMCGEWAGLLLPGGMVGQTKN